jgi:signal transduction histidine kinase
MSVTATTPPETKPNAGATPASRPAAHATAAEPARGLRLAWVPGSLRARIVAWFIGVLAVTTVALVLVTYEVLLIRLDQRIDTELQQEAAELRRLAAGRDPATGEPFGTRVDRIFDVFLLRNVPSPNEALITFVGGQPYKRSAVVVPYRLDEDPELVARWSSLTRPDRGSVTTPVGRVEYLGVPVRSGGVTRGVFVAAIFRDRLREDADSAVLAAGAVALGVLLLGSLVAWRLADRVVRPVTALTRTARSISETDFGTRIPMKGSDEVAQLAATFNDMLDRLERAFASQRRFLDDAGHELRTPLTIVRGHIELLGGDPEEQRETLALVSDELARMGRIVDDLLLLAKHDQPDFLHFSAVELGGLTDELVAKARALAQRDWLVEARARGVIIADRQRLTQAVVQLAENAVRYSDPGEPVALGSSIADGEARIWVRDRGPGVPASERTAIFERFRRGAGRTRAEGSGLGLAIVRTIAEAHHGRVELGSELGAGSVFTMVVPVDQPAGRAEERA